MLLRLRRGARPRILGEVEAMSDVLARARARGLAWPASVAAAAARLRAAGITTYAVGGAVRDALLGIETLDWDLATAAPSDAVAAVFPTAKSIDHQLGAVHLDLSDGIELAITTFRRESDYRDYRHPGHVEFVADLHVDAQRRDFTINAIYVDVDGHWHDPLGGIDDLAHSRLPAIGTPEVRFTEDALRLLRALRFAARYELAIESATYDAVRACASLAAKLSHERVYAELTAAFTGPGRGRALRLLVDSGVATHVLPEVVPMDGVPQPPDYHPEGDVLTHVCLVLDACVPGDPVQAWSAVLHDVGKPPTFTVAADRIRFSGHDTLSADMADAVLRRLHAPRDVRDVVVEVCRDHIKFAGVMHMRPRRRERWLRSPRFAAHLAFHRADCLGSHRKLDVWEAARNALAALPPEPPPPLLTGADVLALGVPAGPQVGALLRALEAEVENLDNVDRAIALAVLRRLVDERGAR